ncbi:MAG: hypothetical protein ACTSV2_01440 [Candidatus Thorarchaeota archaeon]
MRKRNNVRQATVFLVLGIISLVAAFTLSWLSAIGRFPGEPNMIVTIGMGVLVIFFLLALCPFASTILGGNKRMGQPRTPDRDVITRVVRDDSSGKDFFIYGDHDDTVRELIMEVWPFSKELKNTSWYLVDERQNDVTDKMLSEFEGTAKIVFDYTPNHESRSN